jgi:hypothetical protein
MRSKKQKAREHARLNNKQFFFMDEPCRNGHTSEWSVATGRCLQCNRENHRKFFKKERAKDPAEIRERREATQRAKEARQAAIDAGEIHYKSGRDCVNGHKNPWRYVQASNCMECNSNTQLELAKKRKPKAPKTKKRMGRPPKQQQGKIVITEEEHKDESFAAMVRRVYERNQSW